MRKYILIVTLIGFCALNFAQQNLISEKVKENIKLKVDAGDNTGIVIGIFEGDKVEYFSYGKTDIKTGVHVDENSVFEIGSVSKVFTALLLADQVVNKKMKLSDPISMYLPQGIKSPTRNGQEITLQHLSTHSSGLPRLPSNMIIENRIQPYVNYTGKDMLDFLSNYELTRDIGQQWEYSSYGVGLLGYILGLNDKSDYESLMIKKIAIPLKLNDTRVNLTPEMKKRLAWGHRRGIKIHLGHDMTCMAGGAGIRSTVKDLVLFLQANTLLNYTPLKEAMQLSHKQAFKDEKRRREIGLGWFLSDTPNGKLIWHGGNTPGYTSFIGFFEGTNKGVVVLTNSAGNVLDIGRTLLGSKQPLTVPVKQSVFTIMKQEISTNGIESAIALYRKIKLEDTQTYKLKATELNRLGYFYLNAGDIKVSKTIFELNKENFPEDPIVHNALGDWNNRQNNSAEAIVNYQRSIRLKSNDIEANKMLEILNDKN